MNTEIRKHAISLIWRGLNSLEVPAEIVKRFDIIPGGRQEQQISDAISDLRSEIEDVVKGLPETIKQAMRKGFTSAQIFDGIVGVTDLIPEFELRCKISGVAAKLEDEGRPAREAAEKAESQARKAAIQKQIDDAKAALRKMGLPVGE